MSEDYQRIELITGTARRRHWSTEEKLRIIEESFEPGETVSSVARRRGVAPNLLYRWRRLMSEGGVTAVGSDDSSPSTHEMFPLGVLKNRSPLSAAVSSPVVKERNR